MKNTMKDTVTIMLNDLFADSNTARIVEIPRYLEHVKALDLDGRTVRLTGPAPVWLYLVIAHSVHGRARKLVYTSPNTGDILIFDHTC